MDGSEAQEKGHGCRGRFGSCHYIDGTSMGMNEIAQLKRESGQPSYYILWTQAGYGLIRAAFDNLVISDLGEDSSTGNIGKEASYQETNEEWKVRLWKGQI